MKKLTDWLQSFRKDGCNAPDIFATLLDYLKDLMDFLVTEFGTSTRQKLDIQQIQTEIQPLMKMQNLPAKRWKQAQRDTKNDRSNN